MDTPLSKLCPVVKIEIFTFDITYEITRPILTKLGRRVYEMLSLHTKSYVYAGKVNSIKLFVLHIFMLHY